MESVWAAAMTTVEERCVSFLKFIAREDGIHFSAAPPLVLVLIVWLSFIVSGRGGNKRKEKGGQRQQGGDVHRKAGLRENDDDSRTRLLSPYEVPSATWFVRTIAAPARVALCMLLLADKLDGTGVGPGLVLGLFTGAAQMLTRFGSLLLEFVLRPAAINGIFIAVYSGLNNGIVFVKRLVIERHDIASSIVSSLYQLYNSPACLLFGTSLVTVALIRVFTGRFTIFKTLPRRMAAMGYALALASDVRILSPAQSITPTAADASSFMLTDATYDITHAAAARWADMMHIVTLSILVFAPLICFYAFEILAGATTSGNGQETTVKREHERGGVYDGEWSIIGGSERGSASREGNRRSSKEVMKHGVGVYKYANGDSYEGEWRLNKKEGRGIYTFSSGANYAGEWKKGTKNAIFQVTLCFICRVLGTPEKCLVATIQLLITISIIQWFYLGRQDGFGIRILRDGKLISGRWIEGSLEDRNRMPMTSCETAENTHAKEKKLTNFRRLITVSLMLLLINTFEIKMSVRGAYEAASLARLAAKASIKQGKRRATPDIIKFLIAPPLLAVVLSLLGKTMHSVLSRASEGSLGKISYLMSFIGSIDTLPLGVVSSYSTQGLQMCASATVPLILICCGILFPIRSSRLVLGELELKFISNVITLRYVTSLCALALISISIPERMLSVATNSKLLGVAYIMLAPISLITIPYALGKGFEPAVPIIACLSSFVISELLFFFIQSIITLDTFPLLPTVGVSSTNMVAFILLSMALGLSLLSRFVCRHASRSNLFLQNSSGQASSRTGIIAGATTTSPILHKNNTHADLNVSMIQFAKQLKNSPQYRTSRRRTQISIRGFGTCRARYAIASVRAADSIKGPKLRRQSYERTVRLLCPKTKNVVCVH